MDWHWVEQGFDAGEDGGEGEASGGDIQAACAISEQPAPVHQPAEAALDNPATCERDKALLLGIARDDAMAHAVQVAPFPAALGGEGAIEDRLAFGLGSRELARRAAERPQFMAAVTHAVGGFLVPVPGGVLIRDAGKRILGVAGVSGDTSDNDEAAALAGVAAAGLTGDAG